MSEMKKSVSNLGIRSRVFDFKTMSELLPEAVFKRFESDLLTGAATSPKDRKVIADVLYDWGKSKGAKFITQWFFPMRGGKGMVGGRGGMKHDSMIDMDWGYPGIRKPYSGKLSTSLLFEGETDGSSFPSGGLRQTHTAAAYTAWDRGSAPFVHGSTLYVPSAFISHMGSPLDTKTPLLRALDAINREGMRFVKNVGFKGAEGANQATAYLGWEQEFFVISAEMYAKRPDLLACGRTVFGAPPTKGQQSDCNYFGRIPTKVNIFLEEFVQECLACGIPMACYHNEVAPGQHECSPIFCVANQSCDQNQAMMSISANIANKHGLVILFHEKPFAGINGTGKHNNWSVGLDNGVNFMKVGKTKDQQELFMSSLAALAYAVNQHNDVFRIACAGAGNDHRLGAQEAPPAIMSLYPGVGLENKIKAIIAGGKLAGYSGEPCDVKTGARTLVPSIENAGAEDRNRTAPFPICGGNRFEFRAVGGSHDCAWAMSCVNTAFADGMRAFSELVEGGMSVRDATAQLFKENQRAVFTGDGYSKEWPVEAKKRGLPNRNNTLKAVTAFNTKEVKQLFARMKVLSEHDVEARQEIMFEDLATCVSIEAETMVRMVDTGVAPALSRDLAVYRGCEVPELVGNRKDLYKAVCKENEALRSLLSKCPEEPAKGAEYVTNTLRPQMAKLRDAVDAAEVKVQQDMWPFPSYAKILYSHHTQ